MKYLIYFFLFVPIALMARFEADVVTDSISDYHFEQAINYYNEDSTRLAIETFRSIFDETLNEEKIAYYNYKIGVFFLKVGNYDLASNYLYNSFPYYEKNKMSKQYIYILFSLAELKQRIGDNNDGIALLLESQTISKKINDEKSIGNSYNNLGAAYYGIDEYKTALSYYLEAIKYPIDSLSRANSYLNIGSTYGVLKDYENALYYLFKANRFYTNKYKYSDKEAHVYMAIGIIYLSKGEADTGIEYLLKSEELLFNLKTDNLLYVLYNNISFSYYMNEDYKNAAYYFSLYDSVRNIVLSQERIQNAKHYEIKYHKMKNEAKIERQKLQLENKNSVLFIELLIILFLIFFLLFHFLQTKKINKLYKKLVQQNIERIEKEKNYISQKTSLLQAAEDNKTEQYELLADKILELFNTEKVYKDNSLTTGSLAKMLDTNKTYISKAINTKFNKNFNAFLNEFRINESIKIIILDKYSKYTIAYIADLVGFNSISVFIANFKKVTGVTPSVFLKSSQEINKEIQN